MTRRTLLGIGAATVVKAATASVLDPGSFRHYVENFNRTYDEDVINHIADAQAWEWMERNIPLFSCPDREIEEIYYFRWWTFRKHIKQIPEGFLITEFLKPVGHAGDYNSLSCALGHHVAEGRWLRDRQYVQGDLNFWLRGGDSGGLRKNLHQFSGWTAAALHDRWLADGNRESLVAYLDPLLADYAAWEQERLTESGLFWQRDVSDGMESSISGGRRVRNIRPSINSYMYGNAKAIAAIADLAGRGAVAREFGEKAARLRDLIERRLWNAESEFFETRLDSGEFARVREEIGFTPWFFDPAWPRFDAAWKQLRDPAGFAAPFGPTTAERRHPEFRIPYDGDDCQWNGPSWPFSSTITLRALANRQSADFFPTFQTYTRSHRLKRADGSMVPWIDEDLNPLTGEWLAREENS